MKNTASRLSTRIGSLLLAVAISVSWLAVDAVPAGAQTTAGFNASPPLWELNGARGDTISKTYTLSNAGDTDFVVATEIHNFSADPANGAAAKFTDDPTGYDLKSYISLSPATVILKPNSTAEVTVTIRIPQDASPGGHFGAIIFHQGAPPAGGTVKVDQAVTSIILLKVAGQVNSNLSLTKVNGGPGRRLFGMYAGDANISLNSTFVNSGNVHSQPDMTWKVDNKLLGGDSTIHKLTPGYTLPGTTRTYTTDWNTPNLPGIYKVKLTAKYDDKTLTKSTTIVVMPPIWGTGLLIAFLVVVTILGLRRAMRHRASHIKRKKKKKKIVIEVDDDEDDEPSGGHFR